MKKTTLHFIVFAFVFSFLFFSCVSVPQKRIEASRELKGKPVFSSDELVYCFMQKNPNADKSLVQRLAKFYIEEAGVEGINSDVAFAQMCLETGYLKFGNLVVPEMHNYCGLGAIDAQHPGEWFETEQIGVRAHIQHLQAYATNENEKLNLPLVDPRYNWVQKTKFAKDIYALAGVWAADKLYGKKIDAILLFMEQSVASKYKNR